MSESSTTERNLLRELPGPLLRDFLNGRWLPIVGAGMSRNAIVTHGETPPDWQALAEIIAPATDDSERVAPPSSRLSSYSSLYGRQRLIGDLRRALRIDEAVPGKAHLEFAQLGFSTVITTNFDSLIEEAYRQVGQSCFASADEILLPSYRLPNATHLIKMHGDIDHPRSLILTEDDYDGFMVRFPVMATTVSALLVDHTGVLIGYSLEDQDMRQILAALKDRLGAFSRNLWALQINPSDYSIAAFERRGVTVVPLSLREGENAGEILSTLFRQLREYRSGQLRMNLVTSDDELTAALRNPDPIRNICFVDVPSGRLGLYRQYIYPILRSWGLTPSSSTDALAAGVDTSSWRSILSPRTAAVITELHEDDVRTWTDIGNAWPRAVCYVATDTPNASASPTFTQGNVWQGRILHVKEDFDPQEFEDIFREWIKNVAVGKGSRKSIEDLMNSSVTNSTAIYAATSLLDFTLRERTRSDATTPRSSISATASLAELIEAHRRDIESALDFHGEPQASPCTSLQDLVSFRDSLLRQEHYPAELSEVSRRSIQIALDTADRLLQKSGAEHLMDANIYEEELWTPDRTEELLNRLTEDPLNRRQILEFAAFCIDYRIPRDSVFSIAGLPAGRTLRGFTTKIYKAIRDTLDEAGQHISADIFFYPIYEGHESRVQVSHYEVDADLAETIRELGRPAHVDRYNNSDS